LGSTRRSPSRKPLRLLKSGIFLVRRRQEFQASTPSLNFSRCFLFAMQALDAVATRRSLLTKFRLRRERHPGCPRCPPSSEQSRQCDHNQSQRHRETPAETVSLTARPAGFESQRHKHVPSSSQKARGRRHRAEASGGKKFRFKDPWCPPNTPVLTSAYSRTRFLLQCCKICGKPQRKMYGNESVKLGGLE
jgi:hypothetical protein